jgi:hypothetical protein
VNVFADGLGGELLLACSAASPSAPPAPRAARRRARSARNGRGPACSIGIGALVIDVDSGKLVGKIDNTPGAHFTVIDSELDRGFISNGGAARLTIFNTKTLATSGEVKSTGENPGPTVFDPATKRDGLELRLQAAASITAACADGRLLLAHRDREGSRARDGAAIETRPPGLHGAACGSRPDIGRWSAGIHQGRSHPRPRRAQRPDDRTPRALPNPAEELCSFGDRADVQGGSREMVDHLAMYQHEVSPGGRASRTSSPETMHRPIPKRVSTHATWVNAAYKRALDFLHDRAADDSKESRDIDLQDHT